MSEAETKTESPPPPKNSAAKNKSDKKRSNKKKKHVSKHVLKAKSDAKEVVATSSTVAAADSSKKKATANETVKDPSEASDYLQAWQVKEGWKFNKNTQSWLLRHMYEAEKVSKTTFTILLEYMKGLQGKDAKKRVLEEATARAKRYRDYEKAAKEVTSTEKASEEKPKESEVVAASTGATDDDGTYGLGHWNTLDDHDKRKEYKRARRVLEVLTADQ